MLVYGRIYWKPRFTNQRGGSLFTGDITAHWAFTEHLLWGRGPGSGRLEWEVVLAYGGGGEQCDCREGPAAHLGREGCPARAGGAGAELSNRAVVSWLFRKERGKEGSWKKGEREGKKVCVVTVLSEQTSALVFWYLFKKKNQNLGVDNGI